VFDCPSGSPPAAGPFAAIRGFNYQPSWDFSGHVIWRQFQADLMKVELGRGKKYFPRINTVRLWLSFDASIGEPKRVAANFESALEIASEHDLRIIPVLFNNWHSVPDFGGISLEMVRYWSNRQHKTIPANVFDPYLAELVGRHTEDPRVVAWDLCNEPFNSGEDPTYVEWLTWVCGRCKELGTKAPIGVSLAPDIRQTKVFEPISDILMIHPYGNQSYLDDALHLGVQTGKPVLVTECCWGHVDDFERGCITERELTAIRKAGIGFLAHVLHHSLVADCHREQYGPVSTAGFMAFIEADGTLRKHRDVFNHFT